MADRRPVLIEKSAKKYKLMFLLGALMCFPLALMVYLVGVGSDSPMIQTLGGLMFFGGIATSFLARMLAWWHHG